jgi:hypothetical protein
MENSKLFCFSFEKLATVIAFLAQQQTEKLIREASLLPSSPTLCTANENIKGETRKLASINQTTCTE